MSRSRLLLPLGLALLIAAGAYFYFSSSETVQLDEVKTTVSKGAFEITVSATGELAAKRSVKIRAPQGMRAAGIYETTLSDLVPEGTVVEAGEYVGSLDRTELASKMSTVQTEIEKIQTQLEQAKIDTAIELRGLRDQLVNLEFTKEEKLLNVEQNKYEPQSVIQQAELDLERTARDYRQLQKKYELKQQQAVAKIQEVDALLRQNYMKLKTYTDLSKEFMINAPESGMVIYARSWRGKKEPGSRISAWDPIVAELPDLSDMISQTYVNEVDISKVEEGQDVTIKVDAFPDKSYTGSVIKVANIGEQLKGYDAKVFEVVVQVNEVDSILRPAMTTSNEIVTNVFKEVVYVPLEALQNDSLTFVYKASGGQIIKQEVITGLSNADHIIVEHGLEEGETVFLATPAGAENASVESIPEEVKEKILARLEKEEKERQESARRKKEKVKDIPPPSNNHNSGGGMIIFD